MTFFFGLLDVVLTMIIFYDTLSLVYQFRNEGSCDKREYQRICFTWLIFLTFCNYLSCDRKGFLGTLIRLIIFSGKAFIALPVLGGTMKIYKYLFDDGNLEKWYKKVEDLVKSKICKSHSS